MTQSTVEAPQAAAPVGKPHICICTPCYGGQVFQNYFLSVISLVYAAQRRGDIELSFIVRGGDSLITRARNSIVAEFLANERYTHLLWIDGDIGFKPEAIYRLLHSNHEIAAGVYPLKAYRLPDDIPAMKRDELFLRYQGYPFNPVGKSFTVRNGFTEVKDAPTGLMMIQRQVFEKMIKAYPELKYRPDHQVGLENIAAKINDYYYNFFDTIVDEQGRYLSEDYAFCRLWQRIGGKVFVDCESKLTHQGSHQFQGDFAAMLKHRFNRTEGEPKPEAPAPAPEPVPVPVSTEPVPVAVPRLETDAPPPEAPKEPPAE